jgi:hypothetical protein
VGVAAVEDLGKEVAQQAYDLVRDAVAGHRRHVIRHRNRHEADLTARCPGDLPDGFSEGQQPWARQLVDAAGVSVLGEGGGRDVGDVLGVDERLAHIADGERDLAGEHRLEQVALAEVLAEPAAPHDRPLVTGVLHQALGPLGLVLAAAREQHEPPGAGLHGQPREGADRVGGAWQRKIGEEGHVHRHSLAQSGRPRRTVLPVKRRLAPARTHPRRQAAGPKAFHHAPAPPQGHHCADTVTSQPPTSLVSTTSTLAMAGPISASRQEARRWD